MFTQTFPEISENIGMKVFALEFVVQVALSSASSNRPLLGSGHEQHRISGFLFYLDDPARPCH